MRAIQKRASRRGAALVEAAVVIPVMLVFLGCIMFTNRSYEAKLDRQMGTRSGLLYYASHNCEGEAPSGVLPPAKTDDGSGAEAPAGPGTDPKRLGGGGASQGTASGLQRSWNTVRASTDGPVYGSAVQDRRRVFLNRMIHAESKVACNEKSYPNGLKAMTETIGTMARAGGGLK